MLSYLSPARLLGAVYVAIALALPAAPAQARLTLMHGYADYTSALVWIMTDSPGPVEVFWRPPAAGQDEKLVLAATAANGHVVVARLTDLAPGTATVYRVTGDGDAREGAVRTQAWNARPGTGRDFTLALGSCFFLADSDPTWGGQNYGGGFAIFDAIAAAQPDAMLWLGDNVYLQQPDFLDPSAMARRYQRQRTFGPLQKLLTATAHVAIWDDHDYGPNNADASYVMKGATRALFERYWPNPSFGLPDVPGTFGVVRYGDVDVFLLDNRWHRSPNRAPDGPDKTMYGSAQLAWLRNALTYSQAPVKLVAGGGQFLNRANRFEGWNHFAHEQKAFLEFLHERRIEGVVFLSGDRHFGELLKIERAGAYPLYEFTSSPLTSNPWETPERGERENPDVVPGTLVGKRQFGLIRIGAPGPARALVLESLDTAGASLWRHEIPFAALRYPRATP